MTLTRLTRLAAGIVLLASAGLGLAQTPVGVYDNFNDNIQNRNLWFVPDWSDGKFKEKNGHLQLLTNANNTNSPLYQMTGWIPRFTKKFNGADTLNLYCTVRVPHKVPSSDGPISNSYEVGLGLFQSVTNANFIEFTVRDSQHDREFGIWFLAETMDYYETYWSYPAPTNITVFNLRMSYSTKTDMLNFFWAPPNSENWTKVRPGLKMTDLFGPVHAKRMNPYVIGYTENLVLPAAWNVWLDNFLAVYVDRPLPIQ
jgi:hypothetical protein